MFNSRFKITTDELWRMSPEVFNEWRAENDIPELFGYLQFALPRFKEWLDSIKIDVQFLYRTLNIGQIFHGGEKILVRRVETHRKDKVWCVESAEFGRHPWIDRDIRIPGGEHVIRNIAESKFTPYFPWIKSVTGEEHPVVYDQLNNQRADDFCIGHWRGKPPESQAILYFGFPLLKMGNYSLPSGTVLADRNLDFLDLDDLVFGEDVYSQSQSDISYSSIKRLLFEGASQHAYAFYKCWFEDTRISDKSYVQDFQFADCDVGAWYAESSTIMNVGFDRCRVLPFVRDCDLKSKITFRPGAEQFDNGEQTYRLLRIAYQAKGMQKEASEYYYQEQVSHRKNSYARYREKEVIEILGRRPSRWGLPKTFKGVARYYRLLMMWYMAVFSNWGKLSFYIRLKFRWLVSWVDNVLWGYGERPGRIFACSLVTVLFYSTLYYLLSGDIVGQGVKSYLDCLYFSLITFTTLGYGDIYPSSELAKILCGSEALLGAFMIGLVVAGFSNRSRY